MIGGAVVGLGWWGRQVVGSLAGSDEIKVVHLVEPDRAGHAAFAEAQRLPLSADLGAALADPAVEAVILCTPQNLHTGQVLQAAEAGRHVFCEKPLAMTRADAEVSVAACRAAGVVLGVGHERRFEPAMQRLRGLLREGRLGVPLHVEANFSHDKLTHLKSGDWRVDPAYPAAFTGMGIHLTDAFLDLLGPVAEVHAKARRIVSERPNGDTVSVHLTFGSGATGFISSILETPLYLGLRLFGSEGWAEIRNFTHPDTPGPSTLTVRYRDGMCEVEEFGWENAVLLNLSSFARAIRGAEVYPFDDDQKVANIAIMESISQSVEQNVPISLVDTIPS